MIAQSGESATGVSISHVSSMGTPRAKCDRMSASNACSNEAIELFGFSGGSEAMRDQGTEKRGVAFRAAPRRRQGELFIHLAWGPPVTSSATPLMPTRNPHERYAGAEKGIDAAR